MSNFVDAVAMYFFLYEKNSALHCSYLRLFLRQSGDWSSSFLTNFLDGDDHGVPMMTPSHWLPSLLLYYETRSLVVCYHYLLFLYVFLTNFSLFALRNINLHESCFLLLACSARRYYWM